MKYFKFLYLFITDSSFRIWLKLTLFYAFRAHDVAYGFGSSDVLLFMSRYFDKIFTIEERHRFFQEEKYSIPINVLRETIHKLSLEELDQLK